MRLPLVLGLGLVDEVRKVPAHLLERQPAARAAAQQCVDGDTVDPRRSHDRRAVESLQHGVGGHHGDDRPGRRATDRVQAYVQAGLATQMADPGQQRGAGARLVGPE
jgi:hypothetical protein